MEELTREQAIRLISEMSNLEISMCKLEMFILNVDTSKLTKEMKEYLELCNKQLDAMFMYKEALRERLIILMTHSI